MGSDDLPFSSHEGAVCPILAPEPQASPQVRHEQRVSQESLGYRTVALIDDQKVKQRSCAFPCGPVAVRVVVPMRRAVRRSGLKRDEAAVASLRAVQVLNCAQTILDTGHHNVFELVA